jgi:hypothetical protein
MLAAEPPGMYLPALETGGSEFQFNPASAELRQAIKTLEPRRDDLLDPRALAEDLLFLRRALRKQYIGYPELLQLPDFDVEALFDEYITRLRSARAKVKYDESALSLFLELKRHITDRHFALLGPGWNPASADDYTEYQTTISGPAPPLEGCTAPQVSPTTLRVAPVLAADGKPGQLLTVSARPQGDTLELACGQRHITLSGRPRVSREDGMSKKPAYEWRRAGDTVIIRIRRFSGTPGDLDLLAQLAKDYPQHRRSPVIVFDMRANDGGNDDYAHRWIAQAKRGLWAGATWSMYPVGSFGPWWWWNQEVWAAISQDRVDDPASVARRNEWRQKWPRNPAELSVEFRAPRDEGDAKVPYKGRIFVLVDRRCGSSGESAAMAFRNSLGATLVGERTAGALEYGNARLLVLPRTHLVFQFATKRNYFPTPLEAVGTPVDVYLPPELMSKPVEELIPMLKKAAPTTPIVSHGEPPRRGR